MMKSSRQVLAMLAASATMFLAGTATSQAQPREGIGIGIIAGEPSGISLKKWVDQTHAIDGAIALSLTDDNAFQVHVDYLFHDNSSLSTPELKGATPWYYGIGGRLMSRDDDTHFGLRVPLGVTYLFADAPLDVFAEIAPVLDIAPETELDLGGGIGIRYYFR